MDLFNFNEFENWHLQILFEVNVNLKLSKISSTILPLNASTVNAFPKKLPYFLWADVSASGVEMRGKMNVLCKENLFQ